DQRQSGWLVPKAGYDSEGGFDLALPYYWNIAPARDATLRPRLLTDRGLMLGAEYRFLTPRSRGQLSAEFLPDDQAFGDDRSSFRIEHRAQPLTGFYTDLLYQEVSDDDYLDDLGDSIGLLGPDYLDRHLDLNYRARRWQAGLRVQQFQILDRALFPPEDGPYDRLPQLVFDGSLPAQFGGLNLALRGELTRFEHELHVDGTRADLETGFGWPLEWPAGFLRPRLQYRYTAYALDGVEADADDRPDRAAPVGSLDAGLFLERMVDRDWLGGSGLQTLEPRLFYLYVPHRAQDDIPLFDTTEIDRSYTWLFLDNRFTGADRLGDANQLTAAVTTRLLREDDGDERARLSLGQIFYFRDRRVTLDPASPPERDPNSGLIAEGRVALGGGLALRGHYQWDAERDRTQRSALHFNYEPLPNRVINLSHAFVRDTLEQLDLSFAWPVDQRWQVVGRWNYSLALDRNLDTFLGVGYEDCCWALRLLGRQYRDEPRDADARNSVYLQLELKGLSSVGRSIDRLLRDTIFGYEPVRYR
ncbi:MAG: LPS assembly protein LptD, partial [Candidatus Competibacterales bacterium]|nr:LPS assembly protein LptD [Candidatus Competibacterales bacterium]